MAWHVAPIGDQHLARTVDVLAAACAFDDAAAVAAEKLWGDAPGGPATAWGAWDDGALLGVAAASADRLRVLAVHPARRHAGVGGALLAAVEAAAAAAGQRRVRVLDLPGNYLAPGVDVRDVDTIAWLERRGYRRGAVDNTNLVIDVVSNPRVTPARAQAAAAAARARGYLIRRARADEAALPAAIATEFGGTWPFEVTRALAFAPPAVHVAEPIGGGEGTYAAFAAHDGNNAGLGWFGPAGTWPAHRGAGLGEAVLLACLVDVAARHDRCEVAWIGPRPFYERVAGVVGERRFAVLTKDLP